jgi:hypothetical protein
MAKKLMKAQFGAAIKAGIKAAGKTYKKEAVKKAINKRNFEKELDKWPSKQREAYLDRKSDEAFKMKAMLGTGAGVAGFAYANRDSKPKAKPTTSDTTAVKKKGGAVKTKKK